MNESPGFFWREPHLRAMSEGWLIGLFMLLLILPAMDTPKVVTLVMPLIMACAAGWAALRGRLFEGSYRRVFLAETLFSCTAAAVFCLISYAVYTVGARLGLYDPVLAADVNTYVFLVFGPLGCFGVRLISYLWQRWDNLRRTHYLWGLTHALLLAFSGAGALIVLVFILVASRIFEVTFSGMTLNAILARSLIWIISFLLTTVAAVGAGAALLALPVSLFSYAVARRLTDRLESLMQAARSLRCGDLSARVPVQGEDELALLQENFNSMAEALQVSTAALQEERDKVARLLLAQRELTASVSHELRTPVATLSGYVESLQRALPARAAPETRRDLEIIAHEAGRLRTILDDLLTLSQSEVARLSLDIQSVSADEIVRRAVDTFAPLAWNSRRVQVLALPAADLPPVRVDALRLEQIMTNLIQNAVRHTPPGGIVTAGVSRDGAWIHIEVADTGVGISPEELEHVWEKFYRGGDSGEGGSGLGLALVKELTEAMGGNVSAISVPGEGSVFRIRLMVFSS